MIELRFKTKQKTYKEALNPDCIGDMRTKEVTQQYKVLQQRLMTNPLEIGIQPPIWTEWNDVPCVGVDEE